MILVAVAIVAMTGLAFGAGQQDSGPADTSEFVEVTHHVMGNAPTNGMDKIVEAEWNKILEEQVNAHMVLRWIEWADWYTKYNLLLASGEAVDLIHSSSTWLDMWPNAQRGAFLPLDDLIPVYAPLTWEEIPEIDWDQARYNGQIIAFPENDYSQYVNHGFFYRGDWAQEFGITEHIDSYEDLEVYFQGIVDNKEGVIPWDRNNGTTWDMHGWFQTKTDMVLANLPTEYQIFMGESFEEPYTIVPVVFEDLFVDYAEKMHEWYERGFWRRDVLNYTQDTREQLRAGRSGADQHHTQTYRGLRWEMDELYQPGSELQFFAWSDARDNLIAEPITHGATSIGRNSRNPERSVMIYEQLRQNKDLYLLLNYGMEGVQYEIENGVRVRPADYEQATDEFYSDYWGGRVDKFEIPTNTEYAGIYDMWAEFDQIVKSPYPYSKFIFDRTPVEPELAALSDVISQYLKPIMYGVVDDPVAAVEELRDALKQAGHDRVLQEVQRQMNAYKASL
jgi:putative aldouronate transport system substrate-binding protein